MEQLNSSDVQTTYDTKMNKSAISVGEDRDETNYSKQMSDSNYTEQQQ